MKRAMTIANRTPAPMTIVVEPERRHLRLAPGASCEILTPDGRFDDVDSEIEVDLVIFYIPCPKELREC